MAVPDTGWSRYGKSSVADWLLASRMYFGLLTSATAPYTEVSRGGYNRIRLASVTSTGSRALVNYLVEQNAGISWPRSTRAWGSVTAIGAFLSETGGQPVVVYELASAVNIASGKLFTIPNTAGARLSIKAT